MKITREDAIKTKKSILEAAIQIFSDKGYRDATIAEICEKAGTNIASVNYHFGNKESLYIEAWKQTFWESMNAYPHDGGVSESASPEERLKGQIVSFVRRVNDPKNKHFVFMHKEFMNPTGLLGEIVENTIEPLKKKTQALVRELLGDKASDLQVQFCEISIISMCMMPSIHRMNRKAISVGSPRKDIMPPEKMPLEMGNIEEYANHVVKFALVGIRSIREENKKSR